jgi:hypothetical protein
VPEADHCGAYFADRPLYVKKLLDFFEAHLKQQSARPHLVEVDSPEHVEAVEREALEAATAFLADQEEGGTARAAS